MHGSARLVLLSVLLSLRDQYWVNLFYFEVFTGFYIKQDNVFSNRKKVNNMFN